MRVRIFQIGWMVAGFGFAQNTPVSPRFEVASVKPTLTVQAGYGFEHITVHPGSLTMRNVRLRACIKWAYDVRDYQISGPAWLGSPGWLGSDLARYDIDAKATDAPVSELRPMLRSLLADRFQLALHREAKEVPSRALTVIKDSPGLHRSKDQDADPHAIGSSTGFRLENISMAEFAELLSGIVTVPVIDKTGLEGRFSFTLTLGVAGSGDDFQAGIGDAIQEQLGLKMEKQKIQLEMLVIDHAEKKPTDN